MLDAISFFSFLWVPGFRWCLAFSHPLPTKSIYVFVQARLRGPNLFWDMSFQGLADLQCWTLFFLFLFVGSVGDVSAFFAPTGFLAFLVVLGSDLGGVWPFRIHCRRDPFLFLFRLGCATVVVQQRRSPTSF